MCKRWLVQLRVPQKLRATRRLPLVRVSAAKPMELAGALVAKAAANARERPVPSAIANMMKVAANPTMAADVEAAITGHSPPRHCSLSYSLLGPP